MKCFETYELCFNSAEPVGSEAEAGIAATFTCNEKSWKVKGFYDGDGVYKVRFLPQETGHYTWCVTGVVNASGETDCTASEKSHGMVQAEGTHFVYQDGTKYLPFGTTIYALAHQSEELVEQTLSSLREAPFNKVRHCIFPKHYDYNHNDPDLYPFEKNADGKWDVHRPCFAYWKHMEQVILRLADMEIETDLILFHSYDRWGFAFLDMEECRVYLDYALRRLSAIPSIWWSMANEYDIMFNHTIEDWYEIEKIIVDNDPYGHLLSNHNCLKFYDFSRPAITHCCVQTIAMHKADQWQAEFKKPVVYDECCYEGNIQHEWGNISGFEMVNRFWKACVKGAFATHGETFYAEDEVLWWARGGVLKGESPARIAFLKDIMYSLPSNIETWQEFSFEDFSNPTEEKNDNAQEHPFMKLMKSVPTEEAINLQWKSAEFAGHCGEDAYLKYFGGQCAAVSTIKLPADNKYKVEVIDVWEMTRMTLLEEASGKTALTLPGKEGIAVLATRIS